jgi:hypothetical protein
MAKRRKKRGPKPNHLKIRGDWKEAVKRAVSKKKPKEGWPEKEKPKSD